MKKVIIKGISIPAKISSQSHIPIPEDFWTYSTAHMTMNTDKSASNAHVVVIACACINSKSVTSSNILKIAQPNNITTIQMARPTFK